MECLISHVVRMNEVEEELVETLFEDVRSVGGEIASWCYSDGPLVTGYLNVRVGETSSKFLPLILAKTSQGASLETYVSPEERNAEAVRFYAAIYESLEV
jgi:hypothetical protein